MNRAEQSIQSKMISQRRLIGHNIDPNNFNMTQYSELKEKIKGIMENLGYPITAIPDRISLLSGFVILKALDDDFMKDIDIARIKSF